MSDLKTIRWKQRFENLNKAYLLFSEAVDSPRLTRLEMEGLIQRFEYTWELSWKTLKDYLESQGIQTTYPRKVIKEAFHAGLILDGDLWMEMLENRNMISHLYDESTFFNTISAIRERYHPAIRMLVQRMTDELKND